MPTCCVRNCTSRTSHPMQKTHIKYFKFPKEPDIRQKWIDACQRSTTEIKIDAAAVCEHHFEKDCFKIKWTKPRTKDVFSRQIRRLNKDAVPTKMLNLPRKCRKTMLKNEMSNIPINTGIPTYAELVEYSKEKQHMKEEIVIKEEVIIGEHVPPVDDIIQQEIDEDDHYKDISISILLDLLRETKEERKKLLAEKSELAQRNQQLVEENKRLSQQVEQLQLDRIKLLHQSPHSVDIEIFE